ncbi:hypothetical protein MTQ20_02430, partial [Corynebacterium bovis]
RPTGPDMGEAVDFTLGAAASAGVLVGTGDPAFDARLVAAVLSPLASAAGTDQRRRTVTVFSAADVFDGTRPTGPDMGEAVDFTLGAAASAGVLVGTGDPAFDARL